MRFDFCFFDGEWVVFDNATSNQEIIARCKSKEWARLIADLLTKQWKG